MRTSKQIKEELIRAEAELAVLREFGVFWIVPNVEPDPDSPNAKRLRFRAFDNGNRKAIVDKNAKRIRSTSLPLYRNESRAERLLKKLQRTKQAEQLVLREQKLKVELEEAEQRERTVAIERIKTQIKAQMLGQLAPATA